MDVIMGMQNMNGTCVVKCSMPLLYMYILFTHILLLAILLLSLPYNF